MSRLTGFSLRHRALTLLLLLAASALAASGLQRLTSDVGYRAFLGPEHPSIRAFDAFLDRYGAGLPMLAVWSCDESPCGTVFDSASLEMALAVEGAIEETPFVRAVASPATAPMLVASPRGPAVRHLVEDSQFAADRDALAAVAARDPDWVGRLVSEDGRTGAIVVDVSSSRGAAATSVYAALDRALAPFEARGWTFHRAGGPVEFVVAGGELASATAQMVPVMVVLVGATLLVLFRSLPAAVAALATVGFAVLFTMGLHGWLAWPQNSFSQTLPPLVLVIGVSDAIHLVARYADSVVDGRDTSRAERATLLQAIAGDVGGACTMTSLTTAAGFVSFYASHLESFRRFGLIAAFGVMAALVLTFTLLPILLSWVPPERLRTRSVSARWDAALVRLMDFDRDHRAAILGVALLVGIFGSIGVAKLKVDASFEELYGADSDVVRWSSFIADHLARPDRLEVDLTLPAGAEPADPLTLDVLRNVTDDLSHVESLGAAYSLLAPLGTLRAALDTASPPPRPTDASREADAALLRSVLLDEGGVAGASFARWVDRDAGHLRISVQADKSPQDVMRRTLTRVREILGRRLPPGWSASLTGSYAVVHDMVDEIRATQLSSFAGAGITVFVMLAIFLRSLRWALLAIVPTVLPVVATLGVMAFVGIPLDVGSAMVAAVVLGIAVDDAIHMLARLRRLRRGGHSHAQAVHDAVTHVGRALVTTSIALSIGFAALAMSPWQSISNFGLLAAVAILGALAADLLVLPALLLLFGEGAHPESAPTA